MDQWRDTDDDARWLPSFVLPRDAAVMRAVQQAQRYVRVLRDEPTAGFEGYQAVTSDDSPDEQELMEVDLQVQALWATLKRGVLYRNRRGMVQLANGAMCPMGLGPNGAGDVVGYTLVRITPAMCGRVLPIYTELEGKTPAGRLAPHQLTRIEELRDVNAIAGCVRSQEDANAVYQRWQARISGDER